MDSRTTLELHVASQYLAAAAKQYVKPKDDDSHTNIGWNPDAAFFYSRIFPNRDCLVFDTKRMTLEWKGTMGESFALDGHSHAEVVNWLEAVSRKNGVKKFVFDLHYTLESGAISDDFRFGETTAEALDTHANLRNFSVRACHAAMADLGLEAEIRTWPHHFDTGGYFRMSNTDVGIGFGMSIPDSLSDDYYLYTAGYRGNDGFPTAALQALTKGKWISGEWEGAVLAVSGLNESDFVSFFKETIQAIQSNI